MNDVIRRRTTLIASCAALLASPLQVVNAADVLEEIVVTAQRRAQALQDVPVAVSALNEAALEARGIRDFESYLRTIPGAALAELGNQSNEVKLRGVGTGTAQLSPTTAIYLGDVPVIHTGRGLNSSYNFRLVDIERIEVLRGPQGQLYGSNSLGGAIKNIPNKPRLDNFGVSFSGTGSTIEEGGDNYDGDVTLNLPVVADVLGVRLTAYAAEQGGWYDNIYAGGPALASLVPFAPPAIQRPDGSRAVPPGAPLRPFIPIIRPAPPPPTPVGGVPGIIALNPRAAAYAAPSNMEEDVNTTSIAGGRLMMSWAASETFTADLMVAYEDKTTDGTSWATNIPNTPYLSNGVPVPGVYTVPRPNDTRPQPAFLPFLYPTNAREYEQANVTDAGNEDEMLLANLLLEFDLGAMTLTSSSSYWDRTEVLQTDLGVLAFPTTGVIGAFPTIVSRDDNPESIIQEFRLTSDADQRLTWLAGLFYQKIDQDYTQTVTDQSGLDLLYFDRVVRASILGTAPPNADRLVGFQVGSFEDEQYAVFGEIGYDITSSFNAAFSFRYFELDQKSQLENFGFFYSTQGASRRENTDEVFTPKLTLSWTPNEDSLYYLTAAEGFRTGITNRDLPLDLCTRELANAGAALGGDFSSGVPPTESDTLWNYELGAKLEFSDRLVVNGAVFYIDWSDLQGQVFLAALRDPGVPNSTCTFETIFNVGDATIQGVELELSAQLTDSWRIDASASYIDSEYEDDFPQIGISKGQTIEGTPDLTTYVGLNYAFDLFQRELFARLDWNYTGDIEPRGSDFTQQLLPYPIGDFHTLNLRVGAQLSDNVKLDLWVENLTDEFGVTRAIDLAGEGAPTIFTIRPRTAGLTVRFDF